MSQSTAKPPPDRVSALPIAIFAIGALASCALFVQLRKVAAAEDTKRLEQLAQITGSRIEQDLKVYIAALHGGVGLYSASLNIEPHEWRSFVSSLELEARYPAVSALGVVKRVRHAQLSSFVESQRRQVAPSFTVRPFPGFEASEAETHYVVSLVEPVHLDALLGLDLGTEPGRRRAAEEALRTGRATTIPHSNLFPDRSDRMGTVLFLPFTAPPLRDNHDSSSASDRLDGWIVARIDSGPFYSKIRAGSSREIEFAVFDETGSAGRTLVFTTSPALQSPEDGQLRTRLDLGEREILCVWRRSPTFAYAPKAPAYWTGLLAAALTCIVSFMIARTHRDKLRLEGLVKARTLALEASRDELDAKSNLLLRQTEELSRAHEAATAATETKSKFLAHMSHEIRTPLTAIVGLADIIDDEETSPTDRLSAIQAVQRGGNHLLRIVNDILDLSKLEAGKVEVENTRIDVHQAASDVVKLMRWAASVRSLTIELIFKEPWPRFITSDATRVNQVLLNLLSNAIKFTSEGGVTLEVSSRQPDGAATFTVSDTGIGMTSGQLERLFIAFSQGETSARRYGGTGLGLAISHEIAHALGGGIEVESRRGMGSRFTFHVPVRQDAETVSASPEHEEAAPSPHLFPSPALREARVLVAEDNPTNRQFIALVLRKLGVKFHLVENGMQVESAVLAHSFDAVLMDIEMPIMDGLSAVKELRRTGFDKPVVAVTANIRSDIRAKLSELGFNDLLYKPYTARSLHDTLSRVLGAASERSSPVSAPTPKMTTTQLLIEDRGMAEILDDFFRYAPDALEKLGSQVETRDWDTVWRTAHALKGGAANLRLEAVAEAAYDLEKASKNEGGAGTTALLRRLQDAILHAEHWWSSNRNSLI